MTNIKEASLGELSIEKTDFNIFGDDFQIGMFKAIANEEGMLLNINKTLAKKLEADSMTGDSSYFMHKKLLDLYHDPSEWIKHLKCLRNDKECLFRNVAFNSYNGKPIYLSVYLVLAQPFVYGIFRNIDIDIKEIDFSNKKNDKDESEILIIDLDKTSKVSKKGIDYNEIQKSERDNNLDDQKERSNTILLNKDNIEDKIVENVSDNKEQNQVVTNETFLNAPFGIIMQKDGMQKTFYNNKLKEIFNIKVDGIGYYSLFIKYIFPAIESCEDSSINDIENFFKNFIQRMTEEKPVVYKINLLNNNSFQYNIYSVVTIIDKNLNLHQRVFYVFEIPKSVKDKELEDLKKLSFQDELTNINNRRSFDNMLLNNVELAKRYKKPLSIVMFDIDNFKKINDTFGHQKGDEVLQHLASLVKVNIRKSDIFARYGGDEFMILCPETKLPQAMHLSKKISSLIQNYKFPVEQMVTCSFGVTQYKEAEGIHSFIARIDLLLYNAKANGKNRVEMDISEENYDIKNYSNMQLRQ